eukprot:ANDGO_06458.mRNA.1 putative prefoldin subunit 6
MSSNEVNHLTQTYQLIVDEIAASQTKMQGIVANRSKLEQQHTENKMVMQELDLVNPATSSDNVYKLVGPVLIMQKLSEAKETVSRRLEFLASELKKVDDKIAAEEKSQREKREKLLEIQAILNKFMQLSQQQQAQRA